MLLASGSIPTPTNTLDVRLPTPSEPPSIHENDPLRQTIRSHCEMVQYFRNAVPARHHEAAGIGIAYVTQTPEDRLLHLDKHLRRNVLFEHIARETYIHYNWVSTPTTGFSKSEEESVSPGLISQHQDSLSPSMWGMRLLLKPISITLDFKKNGQATSSKTITPTWPHRQELQ